MRTDQAHACPPGRLRSLCAVPTPILRRTDALCGGDTSTAVTIALRRQWIPGVLSGQAMLLNRWIPSPLTLDSPAGFGGKGLAASLAAVLPKTATAKFICSWEEGLDTTRHMLLLSIREGSAAHNRRFSLCVINGRQFNSPPSHACICRYGGRNARGDQLPHEEEHIGTLIRAALESDLCAARFAAGALASPAGGPARPRPRNTGHEHALAQPARPTLSSVRRCIGTTVQRKVPGRKRNQVDAQTPPAAGRRNGGLAQSSACRRRPAAGPACKPVPPATFAYNSAENAMSSGGGVIRNG